MPKSNDKEINLLITPDHTILDGKLIQPNNIAIVLPNGHAYEIEEVVGLLIKRDKKKPAKRRVTARFGRFVDAFKKAVHESAEQPTDYVNESKS